MEIVASKLESQISIFSKCFVARLAAEKEFGLTEAEMTELLTPALYIGRCPEQASAFAEKVKPLLAGADGKSAEINL